MSNQRAHVWRRRAPLYLFVIALAALVVHNMSRAPVEITVVYRFGRLQDRLLGARMTYQREGQALARVRFSYRVHRAPATQRHTVRLPPGHYEIAIELETAEQRAGMASTGIAPPKAVVRHFTRELNARVSGEATVYVEVGRRR